MHRTSFYIVNAITIYRLVAAFLLLYFIVNKNIETFGWLLALSFFTDAIDGFLARKYKVTSVAGSRIDSVADDLTVLMGVIGMIVFKPDFVQKQLVWMLILFGVYFLFMVLSIIRYRRLTSFHTYLAKCAALAQGIFLVSLFFLPTQSAGLFYVAAAITLLDLIEEISLVLLLPKWKADVRGLFWLRKTDVAEPTVLTRSGEADTTLRR